MAIPPAVCVGLRVAVGAEQLEILEAVVIAVPIHMVQLKCQWQSPPLGEPASLASFVLEAFLLATCL